MFPLILSFCFIVRVFFLFQRRFLHLFIYIYFALYLNLNIIICLQNIKNLFHLFLFCFAPLDFFFLQLFFINILCLLNSSQNANIPHLFYIQQKCTKSYSIYIFLHIGHEHQLANQILYFEFLKLLKESPIRIHHFLGKKINWYLLLEKLIHFNWIIWNWIFYIIIIYYINIISNKVRAWRTRYIRY